MGPPTVVLRSETRQSGVRGDARRRSETMRSEIMRGDAMRGTRCRGMRDNATGYNMNRGDTGNMMWSDVGEVQAMACG